MVDHCTKCILHLTLASNVPAETWEFGFVDMSFDGTGGAMTIRTGMELRQITPAGDDLVDYTFYNCYYDITNSSGTEHYIRFPINGSDEDINIVRYYMTSNVAMNILTPRITWHQTPTFTGISGNNLGILRSRPPAQIEFTVINDDDLGATVMSTLLTQMEENNLIVLRFPNYMAEGYLNADLSGRVLNENTEVFQSFQLVVTQFAIREDSVTFDVDAGADDTIINPYRYI